MDGWCLPILPGGGARLLRGRPSGPGARRCRRAGRYRDYIAWLRDAGPGGGRGVLAADPAPGSGRRRRWGSAATPTADPGEPGRIADRGRLLGGDATARLAAHGPGEPVDPEHARPGGLGPAPGPLQRAGRRRLRRDGLGPTAPSWRASRRWSACSSTRCRCACSVDEEAPLRRLAAGPAGRPGRAAAVRVQPRWSQVQGWSEVPRGPAAVREHPRLRELPVRCLARASGRPASGSRRSASWSGRIIPLTVTVVPGEALHLRLGYDARRFDADAIDRMLGHLSRPARRDRRRTRTVASRTCPC